MAWSTPKTTWVNGDNFNVTPDYTRIKGNVEYLVALASDIFGTITVTPLETVTTATLPTESFFNNIVDALSAIQEHCNPTGWQFLRSYEPNGNIWSAEDLNAIETNCRLLYKALPEVRTGLTTLAFTLGGNRFS